MRRRISAVFVTLYGRIEMKNLLTISTFMVILIKSSLAIGMPPIPPDVKSCVAFVFTQNKNGNLSAKGTGFFIGVENNQKDQIFGYFVTAKHVLQKADKKSFLPEIFIRLNKREGGAEPFRLPIIQTGKNKNLFTHTKDKTVDLAVIPLLPDRKKFDYKILPSQLIAIKEDIQKLKIREGSEIFFMGLLGHHIGKERNQPITRFGKIALITDEKIKWDKITTELYLIECASYGGNSGSPVFYYGGAEREPGVLHVGRPILKLVGIIKGYLRTFWPVQTIQVEKDAFVWQSTGVVDVSYQNIGISGVVPAYRLYEILFSDELKKMRSSKK